MSTKAEWQLSLRALERRPQNHFPGPRQGWVFISSLRMAQWNSNCLPEGNWKIVTFKLAISMQSVLAFLGGTVLGLSN